MRPTAACETARKAEKEELSYKKFDIDPPAVKLPGRQRADPRTVKSGLLPEKTDCPAQLKKFPAAMCIPGESWLRELASLFWPEMTGLIPGCPKVGETPMIMMDIRCIWWDYRHMERDSSLAPTERRIVGCVGKFCGYLPEYVTPGSRNARSSAAGLPDEAAELLLSLICLTLESVSVFCQAVSFLQITDSDHTVLVLIHIRQASS